LTLDGEEGATVLDVRPAPDFVRGHLAGSLFVHFDRRTFVAVVRLCAPAQAPVVLVAPDPAVAGAARGLLADAGYRVTETLIPGERGLDALGRPVEPLPTLGAGELAERLAAPAPSVRLVDVRQPFEWKLGYIPGAVLVPLARLPGEAEGWDPADDLALVCEEGVRSVTAVSYLRRRGYRNARSVAGGVAGWARSGRPLVED
jgi:rhodanese-related sulfurtransferase